MATPKIAPEEFVFDEYSDAAIKIAAMSGLTVAQSMSIIDRNLRTPLIDALDLDPVTTGAILRTSVDAVRVALDDLFLKGRTS